MCKCGVSPNGYVPTVLWLSTAINFFIAGLCVTWWLHMKCLNHQHIVLCMEFLMLSMESSLFFNNKGEKSPSHKEQKEIAEGFQEMNTAKLNMVSMAVNGMLIWTKQSSSTECIQLNWTEMMVLMTGCNHRCKFM